MSGVRSLGQVSEGHSTLCGLQAGHTSTESTVRQSRYLGSNLTNPEPVASSLIWELVTGTPKRGGCRPHLTLGQQWPRVSRVHGGISLHMETSELAQPSTAAGRKA